MQSIKPRNSLVLSGHTARRILEAPTGKLAASLDLGLTRSNVSLLADVITLPGGRRIRKQDLAAAFKDAEDCIELTPDRPRKVYIFSQKTGKYYKLFQPTEDRPPTVVIAGATMHAIVKMDPWQDEAEKVATLKARGGECLDTCFGLGYSARLLAVAGFRRVTTCEVDANVLEVAAVNPWSRAALEDARIDIVQADVRKLLRSCKDGRFAAIFHDPPTVHQAGELYSAELYADFARVLASRGVLYHYVGSPGARVGQDYTRGVMERLSAAGFASPRRCARGVLASRART